MCELLARATAAATPEAHFTAGLFSLVEAFANIRMPDLLGELRLAADVDAALLHRLGGLGQVLTEVEAFHAGRLGPLTSTAKCCATPTCRPSPGPTRPSQPPTASAVNNGARHRYSR